MFNISQFLERFRAIGQKSAFSREVVAEVLSQGLGITISSGDFKIQNNVIIFLKTSGSLKSQVFIKKIEILRLLKEKCKEEAPYDIR